MRASPLLILALAACKGGGDTEETDAEDLSELLGILITPEQAVIPIGDPTGSFGPVRRRPVDEVMMVDRWTS